MKKCENIVLAALNAKYIHPCPAVYSLKEYAREYRDRIERNGPEEFLALDGSIRREYAGNRRVFSVKKPLKKPDDRKKQSRKKKGRRDEHGSH